MKVTRARLTEDEKKAWQNFCQASHVSESEMLRIMIRKVTGCAPHTAASRAELKSEKVTVRFVEFRESNKVKREAIDALSKRIDEHRALVFELLNKNMNRWS